MSATITYAITTPLTLTTTGTTNVTLPTSGTLLAATAGALAVTSGGTGLTSTTANQILYSSGTNTIAGLATANNGVLITSAAGVPSILAAGTTGQVLTATTGSPPAWATPVLGRLVLIQSQTASSSSSIVFTTGISTTYKTYLFIYSSIVLSTSGNLNLNVSVNGGSSYLATGYLSGLNYNLYNSATASNINNTVTIYLGTGENVYSGQLWCYNIDTANPPYFSGVALTDVSGVFYQQVAIATNTTTSGVNAFQFIPTSGTFTSGTITLFGVLE
jgi:hypothetical protein